MTRVRLRVAWVPLVDAAPLIVAREIGFAAEEGLTLDLMRAPSWSSARDMLTFGAVEAAHMLSPVPVAMSLGLGGTAGQVIAPMILSVNGTSIGVSEALARRMPPEAFGFDDATVAGRALIAAAQGPLRVGVPFPFSMHAELLFFWLTTLGLPAPEALSVRSIPPPLMAEALAAGEIDAFCVGEPWGTLAVERGAGRLLLPSRAIWSFAPEKVLALRRDWVESEPDLTGRLMRALWRAGRWLAQPEAHVAAAELLGRPEWLDLPAEWIDRALTGHMMISPQGDSRRVDGFVQFHDGAATFPWRSQAAWIGARMAGRLGLERSAAVKTAQDVFRSDLYRRHLGPAGALLPGASSKVEGAIRSGTAVPSEGGRLLLAENRFFDGRVFDPDAEN
ncbi:CmpA/NrtA family ABC transporter substrate-binding protein [Jannaschia pohangensis]|uniref:NitT/TauT family transport system ATP-binding protein n=1 Tax=Jannaschia pohangensis TaxID=390807 RepID=A0A1I3HFA9_9RHOB|nr:CmpA/NrtA family ABC transporter substrate-binding protein [Jannaschia pohangensis]SFI34311.1 NitT/TauT family transport system ATP-binding protein [Jannaschia pohangensis]